jgi:hypothetical protein
MKKQPPNSTQATADQERTQFSERLRQALCDANYNDNSPTDLSRQFNARFSGRPITVHAARKWLVAEAIPAQEKLRVLSDMLGVTAEWLRFGGKAEKPAAHGGDAMLAAADARLVSDIRHLSKRDHAIVRELIRTLVRTSVKEAA